MDSKKMLVTASIICAAAVVISIVGVGAAYWKYSKTAKSLQGEQTTASAKLNSGMVYTSPEASTNIYEEPDSGSRVLMQLAKDASVTFVSLAKDGFYRVNANGNIGYIQSDRLVDKNLATQAPASTASPTAAPQTVIVQQDNRQAPPPTVQHATGSSDVSVKSTMYIVNVNDSVYLRKYAEENTDHFCTIPLGSAVGYIEDVGNGFYKVKYEGTIGYVKSQYLSYYSPHYRSSGSTSSSVMYVSGVKNSIYLRKTPTDPAEYICEIPVGAAVNYLSDAGNGYYKISYNGYVGYATAQYLR